MLIEIDDIKRKGNVIESNNMCSSLALIKSIELTINIYH